ncbi:hypothetical protein GZH53_06335 [Flavihumibacter sp. R14]|nr:hypothetical protein [Flavihumibacter soli]
MEGVSTAGHTSNTTTTYQAARLVAPVIEAHFAEHLSSSTPMGAGNAASHPDTALIEVLIDTAFWTSLRKEEGISPKISLALLPPEQAGEPLIFVHNIVLNAEALTKLAPGVERPGIHVGVWYNEAGLYIWGTTYNIPDYCLVLDVSEPALLVIKHRRFDGFGKFVNIAVLKGDQVKIIDQGSAYKPDCPTLLTSLLGFRAPGDKSVNVLIQLAVSMRAHKRGGLLLVVPSGTEDWRESILHPVKYAVTQSPSTLAQLMMFDDGERGSSAWKSALGREVESIGGLTAIDGATVISDRHELLAFGAKIVRPHNNQIVGKIKRTEPVVGSTPIITHPASNGGTRHMSAAQFVHDQRKALALVASQDGHFTVFTWSDCEGMVHAHRIDVLLV